MVDESYYRTVKRILIMIFVLNISVAAAKGIYGWFTNSLSMMTDGLHSFFDSTSNIIGIVGITLAARPPDKEHPYGHGKFETFASVGIVILLFVTCFEVVETSIKRFQSPTATESPP